MNRPLAAAGIAGVLAAAGAAIYFTQRRRRRAPPVPGELGRGGRSARSARSLRDGLSPIFEQRGRGGQVVKGYKKDDLSIQERLELMQGMVAADVRDPEMRRTSLSITNRCPERDDLCELKAIYADTKKNVRYSGDVGPHKLWPGGPIESVDFYSSGKRTLEAGAGDCDDQAVLNASRAVLNGFTAKFRATSPYRWGKSNYTHVYTLVGLPKNNPTRWVAVDTTLPGDNHLGEEYPFAKHFDVIA